MCTRLAHLEGSVAGRISRARNSFWRCRLPFSSARSRRPGNSMVRPFPVSSVSKSHGGLALPLLMPSTARDLLSLSLTTNRSASVSPRWAWADIRKVVPTRTRSTMPIHFIQRFCRSTDSSHAKTCASSEGCVVTFELLIVGESTVPWEGPHGAVCQYFSTRMPNDSLTCRSTRRSRAGHSRPACISACRFAGSRGPTSGG